MDTTYQIYNVISELKKQLLDGDSVDVLNIDLVNSSLDASLYSDDLYIYRSTDDKFVYIYDESDNTEVKLSVDDLKIILEGVANRRVDDEIELEELENYLYSEDDV